MISSNARSLKSRIVLTLCSFSVMLSLVYSGLIVFTSSGSQDYVFNAETKRLTESVLTKYLNGESITDIPHSKFIVSIGLEGLDGDLVKALRLASLPEGIYESQTPYDLHFSVSKLPDSEKRLYVLYDVSELESPLSEESIQIAEVLVSALVTSVLGVILGLLLADKVISPVSRLAARVRNSGPDKLPLQFSKDMPADEVGELARTIEESMQRLADFVDREKEFTRNVSHELRTPLAVVKNGAELLRSSVNEPSPIVISTLDRIDRAVTEMERLVTTFLLLARENDLSNMNTSCSLCNLITETVEKYSYLLDGKNVTCMINAREDVVVNAPVGLLEVVLGNLIRNAFQYVSEGKIEITMEKSSLSITNEVSGYTDRPEELDAMTHGIGHSITARLCEHLGYSFNFTKDGSHAAASIKF